MESRSSFRRCLVFYSVGAMGIVVQMGALLILTRAIKLNYLLATASAVEVAVLHNFFWHERWTWADRTKGNKDGLLRRFVCFHLTNGALSLAGNVVLMWLFVGTLSINSALANALAIALCSILSFIAGDRPLR